MSVVTGISGYLLSATSAAYAPTNTADVTSIIGSAVSGKLDESSIETSIDGITGIAGTAIAVGGGTTYTAGQYIQISGDEISVTGIDPSSYAQSSSLSDYQTTAAMSAYASTADLSAKLDVSAIQFVSASSEATASGVLYIVTASA